MNERVSTLWIVVLLNMLFADILNFITPDTLRETMAMDLAPGVLLLFAVLLEIPIAMVFLSRTLKPRANRTANVVAAVVTIVFTVAGGTLNLHYAFFAAVEVGCLLLIIRNVTAAGRSPALQ